MAKFYIIAAVLAVLCFQTSEAQLVSAPFHFFSIPFELIGLSDQSDSLFERFGIAYLFRRSNLNQTLGPNESNTFAYNFTYGFIKGM